MKKIISILLAVMLVVSLTVVSTSAASYTVSSSTPYADEAIAEAGGAETITLYFQAPENWYNKFNMIDGNDYGQICIYWFSGIAACPDWVGYKARLVDAENRIFSAEVPHPDTGTATILWNNGVNGGMDKTAEIYNYAAQVKDTNIEGAEEGDLDTIPEGTPDPYSFDGCILIPDPSRTSINELSGVEECEGDWYFYYGNGCYGNYDVNSANFHGRLASCVNPNHDHPRPGDVNKDKSVDILDVLCIQRYLADLDQPAGVDFDLDAADVDEDGYISIIDCTRIQRYLAKLCNIDGSKPYVEEE